MQSAKTIKPLLRWVGGKYNQTNVWQRLTELYAPFANTHTWVEPFCGGLGATLRVMPKTALLNDDNQYLINFYKWYRGFAYDRRWIATLPQQVTEQNYYELRDIYNKRDHVSMLFWWLNHACFQGLYRVNSKGEFNTPMGRDSKRQPLKITFPTDEEILDFIKAVTSWSFYNMPFNDFLKIDPEGQYFLYCDPPYDQGFTSYTPGDFTWKDQETLATMIADQCCPAVISNLATPRIIDLYQGLGYTLEFMNCRRSVSCNGDRVPVREVLATINMEIWYT